MPVVLVEPVPVGEGDFDPVGVVLTVPVCRFVCVPVCERVDGYVGVSVGGFTGRCGSDRWRRTASKRLSPSPVWSAWVSTVGGLYTAMMTASSYSTRGCMLFREPSQGRDAGTRSDRCASAGG